MNYVPMNFRDKKMCRTAIKQNIQSIVYVPSELISPEEAHQIPVEYLMAVDRNILTVELCEKVVRYDGMSLVQIPKSLRTEKVCKLALMQNASCAFKIEEDVLKKILLELKEDLNHPSISKLELICKLQEGETISYTYSTIMVHDSWYTRLWRTFSSDTRKLTIQWIRDAYESCKDVFVPKGLIVKSLKNLDTLKVTYAGDGETIEEIVRIQGEYMIL